MLRYRLWIFGVSYWCFGRFLLVHIFANSKFWRKMRIFIFVKFRFQWISFYHISLNANEIKRERNKTWISLYDTSLLTSNINKMLKYRKNNRTWHPYISLLFYKILFEYLFLLINSLNWNVLTLLIFANLEEICLIRQKIWAQKYTRKNYYQ